METSGLARLSEVAIGEEAGGFAGGVTIALLSGLSMVRLCGQQGYTLDGKERIPPCPSS